MTADLPGGHRSSRKVWIGLVLLAATVAATIPLGRWQLRRAQEKLDLMATVAAGRRQPPLSLSPQDPPAELKPWRPAIATGRWLADRTILLDNRTAGGRPGFWVVTPLLLTGTVSNGSAVAVLRGWLPRQFPDTPTRSIPAASGQVEVRGELVDHVPRLLELASSSSTLPASLPDPAGVVPRVQNLALPAYAKASGLNLMPVLLQQTSQSADGLLQEWPEPPSNVDMHRGYALQWFSFAAIAAVAFGVLLVRHLRSIRRR